MNRMTIGELRDECDERGIAFSAKAQKVELIALLQAHRRRAAFFEQHNSWLTLVGLLAALVASLYGGYEWVFACDRDCRAERLLLSREVVPVVEGMPPYVPRPQIEAILAHAIGHTDQTYVALIGPRGVGKTRVVAANCLARFDALGFHSRERQLLCAAQ